MKESRRSGPVKRWGRFPKYSIPLDPFMPFLLLFCLLLEHLFLSCPLIVDAPQGSSLTQMFFSVFMCCLGNLNYSRHSNELQVRWLAKSQTPHSPLRHASQMFRGTSNSTRARQTLWFFPKCSPPPWFLCQVIQLPKGSSSPSLCVHPIIHLIKTPN